MKQSIIYIAIVVLLMYFIYDLYSHKEGLTEKLSNIVLLGDSVFKNNSYVPSNKSIEYLLKENVTIPSLVLAEDGAIIYDLMNQYNTMPKELNTPTTRLYISVGGNDLLAVYENISTNTMDPLNSVWNLYSDTIQTLIKSTQCTIVLTDIYFVTDPEYNKYTPIVEQWNANLYEFAATYKLAVFKISDLLTKPSDFTNSIEPSATGSVKIVNSFT